MKVKNGNQIQIKLERNTQCGIPDNEFRLVSIRGAIAAKVYNGTEKIADLKVGNSCSERIATLLAADKWYDVTVVPAKEGK